MPRSLLNLACRFSHTPQCKCAPESCAATRGIQRLSLFFLYDFGGFWACMRDGIWLHSAAASPRSLTNIKIPLSEGSLDEFTCFTLLCRGSNNSLYFKAPQSQPVLFWLCLNKQRLGHVSLPRKVPISTPGSHHPHPNTHLKGSVFVKS